MHPFKQEAETFVAILTEAYTKINLIDKVEVNLLKNQILQDLLKNINMLNIQLGVNPSSDLMLSSFANVKQPLKKMFGKDITDEGTATGAPIAKDSGANSPARDSLIPGAEAIIDAELSEKVNFLYPVFSTYENDYILDNLADVEVRALAKRAGVPVTEDNPRKLTFEFLDLIKAGIKLQQENTAKGVHDFNNPNSNAVRVGEATDSTTDDQDVSSNDIPDANGVTKTMYDAFEDMSQEDVEQLLSDDLVKGIGLRAGLPKHTGKVDKKYIEYVKKAIKKHREEDEKKHRDEDAEK